jgi:hypothetical protein
MPGPQDYPYTTKDVLARLGQNKNSIINHWFEALELKPYQTAKGKFLYSEDMIQGLLRVRDLRDQGRPLSVIRGVIDSEFPGVFFTTQSVDTNPTPATQPVVDIGLVSTQQPPVVPVVDVSLVSGGQRAVDVGQASTGHPVDEDSTRVVLRELVANLPLEPIARQVAETVLQRLPGVFSQQMQQMAQDLQASREEAREATEHLSDLVDQHEATKAQMTAMQDELSQLRGILGTISQQLQPVEKPGLFSRLFKSRVQ